MEVHVQGSMWVEIRTPPFPKIQTYLRVYSAHSLKKPTLSLSDAYDFLKVQFLMNKLKTSKLYFIFNL